MINGQKEIWIRTSTSKNSNPMRIIAVSNCGRIMRHNGTIEFCNYRKQRITTDDGQVVLSQFLLSFFKGIDNNRSIADHISHNPKDMCVNDIRNLRWATNKENANFEEAHENQRNAALNRSKNSFGKLYFEKYHLSYRDDTSKYNKAWYRFKTYGELP